MHEHPLFSTVAALEMRWRETRDVAAIFPYADTTRESMGKYKWKESSGEKRVRVRKEIVFVHAKAILAPPKEGSAKPIGL